MCIGLIPRFLKCTYFNVHTQTHTLSIAINVFFFFCRDESSDDEEPVRKGKHQKEEKEADIGKVVCVEVSDKKKQKDNWFPGLVVAPTAQDTVRIHVREDYLVRSFKDGR